MTKSLSARKARGKTGKACVEFCSQPGGHEWFLHERIYALEDELAGHEDCVNVANEGRRKAEAEVERLNRLLDQWEVQTGWKGGGHKSLSSGKASGKTTGTSPSPPRRHYSDCICMVCEAARKEAK